MADGNDVPADQEGPPTIEEMIKRRRIGAAKQIIEFLMMAPESRDNLLFSMKLRQMLTDIELIELIGLMLGTVPADIAYYTVQRAFEGAGWPTTGLMADPQADAKYWANDANANELKAYGAACFNAMSDKNRAAFLAWARKQSGDV